MDGALPGNEQVCDAFRHNWTKWRHTYPPDWQGLDQYMKWHEHPAHLCELTRSDDESEAESAKNRGADVIAPETEDEGNECLSVWGRGS
jgi:hypothetical protein